MENPETHETPAPAPTSDIHVRSQFGKHVPRILRRQLILQLMQQYLVDEKTAENTGSQTSTNECKATIQRFHGALLFVDISGFTALSTKLTPEDLKHHINEYFTKMLDIVDKHGGDVIKFAGDALFIIWETSHMFKNNDQDESGPMDFHSASKAAIGTAVECGLEICSTCGNHRVSLLPRNVVDMSAERTTIIKTGINHNAISEENISVHLTDKKDETVAFLNVHCGVTIGLMAGIDIGCNDRWEYFLMGEPLTSVAMAEAQASTGEIVISPEGHALLHPAVRPAFRRTMTKTRLKISESFLMNTGSSLMSQTTPLGSFSSDLNDLHVTLPKEKEEKQAAATAAASSSSSNEVTLPCGCHKGTNGFCKIKKSTLLSASNQSKRNKIKSKIDEVHVFDETNGEIESVFDNFMASRLYELSSIEEIQNEFCREVSNTVATNKIIKGAFKMKNVSNAVIVVSKFAERVKLGFIQWAHSCLIDDIARHVHDVVRTTYKFEDVNRADACRREIQKQLESIHTLQNELQAKQMFRDSMMKARMKKMEQSVKIMEGSSNFLKRTMSSGGVSSLRKKPSTHQLLGEQTAGFSAEIRSVTVMFVKIDMPHMELLVEQNNFGDHIGQFGFLSKTVNESLADVLLLHRLQSCIEALTASFAAHGGQLRQFIVDDKGTVCIGTFGLRGAVSEDNAAAALETANMIVIKLQGLGLNCSIGVTMGKAFCGLVGSETRHEYAVMGPSTNLSARLMCKAPPGGIICDREIRTHDRKHQFIQLADIIAKGYALPVGTFKPIFKHEDDLTVTKSRLMTMLSYNMRRSTRKSGLISSEGSTLERQDSMSSNEDNNINEEGGNWVVAKMCKGPFQVTVPADQKGSSDGKTRRELIGRQSEVRAILTFLFSRLVDEEEEVARFSTDQSSRFVGILGPQGIGKSSVISAVVQQVTSVVVSEPSLKLHVFKSRINGFQAGMPFNSFKPIFTEMFIRIFNISKNIGGRNRRRSAVLGNTASSDEIIAGISYCMKLLPEKLRTLEPLLGYLTFVPEQPEAIAALNMNAQDMVLSATELLFEIMQLYVKNTKNLVFLVIEDVHSFDLASLTLLRQIWTSGQGVIVMFTAEKVVVRSGVTRTNRASSAANKNSTISSSSEDAGTLVSTDFAASLNEPERYLSLELELFTQADTAAIVKSALSNCGVAGTDRVILERIFAESGGNPMYAYELAKLIAQQQDELIDPSMILLKLTHCHRLEEIICHRFDQLGTSAQTLLKLAAAICCFGSSFTLDMLLYVMSDTDHEGVVAPPTDASREHDKKIINDLFDIVNSESFMRAVPVQTPAEDEHPEITVEGIANNHFTFEFAIALEKSTIYELLLSDQKQVIHERIAEYFQMMRKNNPNAQQHFAEESLHWQRASNWSYAMACSYHASLAEPNEHKAGEHIDTAYRMYRAMRDQQEASGLNDKWTLEQMKRLYEHALSKSKLIHEDSDCCNLTLDDISQMFNCDSELLKISLYVEILMARKCVLRMDRLKESQLYLEEALQILLLTKNPFLLSSARVTELMHFLHFEPLKHEMDENEFYFSVAKEFEPICLKLFSVYIENYLQMVTEPELSNLMSKVQFAMKRFHEMTKEKGGFHEIQCLALEMALHCKVGNLKHASAIGQKITEVYDAEKHSSDLIAFYGRDIVPTMLAMIAQYLFLSSEWKTPYRYQHFAHQVVEKITHCESIAFAVYFITNNLVFLCRFDEALKLYEHYFDQLEKMNEVRSMTEGFYMEWLRRLSKYEQFIKTGDTHVFYDDVTVVDTMIQQGCVAMNMESTTGGVTTFDRLSVQGRGIDAVLAEVCALKIIALWNSKDSGGNKLEELRVYCRALGVYVRSTLSITSGRPHELMFGKTSTLLVMLHLMQTVAPPTNRSRLTSRHDRIDRSRSSSQDGDLMVASSMASPADSEKKRLFEMVTCVLAVSQLNHLRRDCHPQYSVFTLLSVNLVTKLLSELHHVAANALQPEAAGPEAELLDKITEEEEETEETEPETPPPDDLMKDSDYFQQFLINGSTELKLKVCDWSKMSQLASPVHVAQMANR